MDFTTIVDLAKQLHVDATPVRELNIRKEVEGPVYGRICSSISRECPPERLTNDSRRTVFVFGPDAIISVVLRLESYHAIASLGFTKEYIKHELIEKNSPYWLLLFKPSEKQQHLFVKATWNGVTHIIHSLYPNVYPDLMVHLQTLKITPFNEFEKQAGFKFLECRRNIDGIYPDKPPYYSYDFYSSLPKPRTAMQVRLFLYCEMRLLEMFRGDGYASTVEPGSVHCLEYLCPNLKLSDFDKECVAVLPMNNVIIPD